MRYRARRMDARIDESSQALAPWVELRPTSFVRNDVSSRLRGVVGTMAAVWFVHLLVTIVRAPTLAAIGGATAVILAVTLLRRIGRGELRRAREAFSDPRTRRGAVRAFERLARRRLSPQPAKVDAWGYAALHRLEAGDLDGALLHAHRIGAMAGHQTRRRTPDMGFLGEAVMSVMGRLFPETKLRVPKASVFHAAQDRAAEAEDPQLPSVLAVLRLLEAAGHGDRGAVIRAFNELPGRQLERDLPTLRLLAWAAAARTEPALADGLVDALEALCDAQQALIRRRFSELQTSAMGAYRRAEEVPEAALALQSPPGALQELATSAPPSRWFPVVAAPVRMTGWMFMAMAMLSAATMGVSVAALAMCGIAVAILVPSSAGRLYHRWTRVAPLRTAGIADPIWLGELARSRTRSGPLSGDDARLYPFDRGELMLFVALHRAEASLGRGAIDEAHGQIDWWLVGAEDATLQRLDTHPVAAGLMRMATLLDRPEVAARISIRAALATAPSRSVRGRRSGRGDAPQAVALARALMHARQRRWEHAGQELLRAADARSVVLDDFELALYGELVRRVRANASVAEGILGKLEQVASPPWIATVWPAGDSVEAR